MLILYILVTLTKFIVNLPACVFDIITVNGMINLIVNPTHFSGNSETLIDPILVTDSIPVIYSYTMPIDRSISDHDGTYMYVTIHSGYDHKISFTRDDWNYKRAHYDLMKSKIKEVNWYELIYKTTEINKLVNLLTVRISSTQADRLTMQFLLRSPRDIILTFSSIAAFNIS
jgi:hypothetical protein